MMLTFAIIETMLLITMAFRFAIVIDAIYLFCLGFVSGAVILSFTVARKLAPMEMHGVTTGFINMFFGLVGVLMMPLLGYLLGTGKDNFLLAALVAEIFGVSAIVVCIILLFKKDEHRQL